jgi:hypothetical protein
VASEPNLDETLRAFQPVEGWGLLQSGDSSITDVTRQVTSSENTGEPTVVDVDDLDEWAARRAEEMRAEGPSVEAQHYTGYLYGPGEAQGVPESGVLIHVGARTEQVDLGGSAGAREVVLTTANEVVRIRSFGPDAPDVEAVADRLEGA